MIYYLVFVISSLITYLAQKSFKSSKKILGIILSFIAILIPSVLAGIRHSSIGADVEFYVYPAFKDSLQLTFSEFFIKYNSILESGYAIFVFCIAKITNNFQILLFVIQFTNLYFVYRFLYIKKEKIPMHFALFIYFLLCYNNSLNIIRQSLAIAIILYSIALFENKKYIKTAIFFVLALSFHKSAIFAIPMYILIYINDNFKNGKFIINILCASLIILICFSKPIILGLCNMHLLPTRYYIYFTKYSVPELNFRTVETLFKLVWICLYVFYLKILKKHHKDEKINIYFIFLIIDMILFPISYKISNADRLGWYYFFSGSMIIIPETIKIVENNKKWKVIGYMFIITILTTYWYRLFIHFGSAATYPYRLFLN